MAGTAGGGVRCFFADSSRAKRGEKRDVQRDMAPSFKQRVRRRGAIYLKCCLHGSPQNFACVQVHVSSRGGSSSAVSATGSLDLLSCPYVDGFLTDLAGQVGNPADPCNILSGESYLERVCRL